MTGSMLDLVKLSRMLDSLQLAIARHVRVHRHDLAAVDPEFRRDAHNLIAFITLGGKRERELRRLCDLHALAIPSAAPEQVPEAISRLRTSIREMTGGITKGPRVPRPPIRLTAGIVKRTASLFGQRRRGCAAHIMVTLPDDAATNVATLRNLLRGGMSVARINCAQLNSACWKAMIRNVRKASRETGIACRILMDLSGPKLRTGEMVSGPCVIRIRPRRDALGNTVAAVPLLLVASGRKSHAGPVPAIPVATRWLKDLRPGTKITLVDARGKKRSLLAGASQDAGRRATCRETAYLQTGTRLTYRDVRGRFRTAKVGALPPLEVRIQLRRGDLLRIHREPAAGEPARFDGIGKHQIAAHISCTLPQVFRRVRPGQKVVFDNGVIEGIVEKAGPAAFFVRITHTAGTSASLRADKGINLPQTDVAVRGLTPKDRNDLRFASRHADLVSLSFVRDPQDVLAVQGAIRRLRGKKPGVVIKIETAHAVEHLTRILLATMRYPRSGIMMARGDLAVEYGWERLAGLEQLMLDMCRAAGIPFAVATEILDSMARRGLPTRAEITDASVAADAQCILLSKGPHIVPAVRLLRRIIRVRSAPAEGGI